MKIRFSIPKADHEYEQELKQNNWTPLKEPQSIGKATLISIPFMIVNLVICLAVIIMVDGLSWHEFGFTEEGFRFTLSLSHIVWFFAMIIIHELIHLVFVPNFLKSNKTYLGITLQAGFILTEDMISKSRFLIVSFAPFILISIILPIILSWFGLLTPLLKVLIIINGVSSSVDFLNSFMIMRQVPKGGSIINNGFRTYWKAA
ncbi:DUF3267 domain-containing protein [Aquisalibacillus elongatus]|uniref:Putative zincin peptidase n=1 Tax=Aquisalibacillus elongatus TaxID=485577 RepID=A0A3N5B998_9BACI|nr:DUF3267 domain-containing protein [Aquisalibacillus elongatus]RPF53937.1 putative zincin peptidase [Aquisalibacillus elongatus]